MTESSKNKQSLQPVKSIGSVVSKAIIAIVIVVGVAGLLFLIIGVLTLRAISTSCTPSDSKRQELIVERTRSLNNMTILSGQKIQSEHNSYDCDEEASTKLQTALNTKQAMADIHNNLKTQGFMPDKDNGPLLFTNGEDQPLYFREGFVKKKQSITTIYNFSVLRTCAELQQDCNSDTLNDNALQLPLADIDVIYGEK